MDFKSVSASILLIIFSIIYISFSYAKEPPNLDSIKKELIRYHDSDAYAKDIARVAERAKAYLKVRIDKNKKLASSQKFAIVLDIDETALSNYPNMLAMNFGGALPDIEAAIGRGTDPAIEPTLKLYQFAEANHVAVFFITGRREPYRTATIENLKKAGYSDWDGLYLMPEKPASKVSAFKVAIRKEIIDKGYDIILSLSDQKADLKGGYADKAFKLPDPYYLVT